MPGGVIAPDGRASQAPGIGKTAKRHDLEGTPGLHDSSLQQGDVQMLEEGQRSQKQTQAPAAGGTAPTAGAPTAKPNVQVPDAIDFAASREGGTLDAGMIGAQVQEFNLEAWTPLMKALARDPGVSGPLTTALISQLSNAKNTAASINVQVIDQNAADDAIRIGIS